MKLPVLFSWQDDNTMYWSDNLEDMPPMANYWTTNEIEINSIDLVGVLHRICELTGKHVWIKFDDFFYSSRQGGELSDR